LDANPQNFQAVLMLAKYYSTTTRENDLDREEKLGKEEKYANQVIEMMKTAPKPNPAIPDDQWVDIRKDIAAEAYNAIGLGNLTRKKYDAAAANFKQAVEANSRPEPAYMVRLASALQAAGKNDDAITWCDKILADAGAHPQIKSLATNIRAAAVKAGGKAPGGAPAAQ
jgi:tetratricopeptide (TPR) repeat protein